MTLPVKENEKTYTAFLCSSPPNNDCNICSHFLPDYVRSTTPIKTELSFGFHTPARCWSCKRSCVRVFVAKGMDLPNRVPADYPMKYPSGLFAPNNEGAKIHEMGEDKVHSFLMEYRPISPREDIDWDARSEWIDNYFKNKNSTQTDRLRKSVKEEENVIPVSRGKLVKRKLRF